MNEATRAARRQLASERIAAAVETLARRSDMKAEAEALASIQEKDPRVKELFTLEALAAILEKEAQIKGGRASIEPTYRVTQQELDELQQYREHHAGLESVPPSGDLPERPPIGGWNGDLVDDGVLYQIGQTEGPRCVLPVALVTQIGGASQPVILADLHPERIRLAAAALRDQVADQASYSQAAGEPAPKGDEPPAVEPGRPGAPIDSTHPDMDVFTAQQRQALAESGLGTPEQVRAASDEQLLAVKGIAAGTLAKFREQRPSPDQEPPAQPPPPSPPGADSVDLHGEGNS